MKKICCFFVFLVSLSLVNSSINPQEVSEMTINFTFSQTINYTLLRSTGEYEFHLWKYPQNASKYDDSYHQEIISESFYGLNYTEYALDEHNNTYLKLKRVVVENKSITYSFSYIINIVAIDEFIDTNVNYTPQNLYEPAYVQNTSLIQSRNETIRNKALEIVGNYSSLFEIVGKLAIWVSDNIEYSYDYTNSSGTYDDYISNNQLSAQWVYDNRIGVCDEFAILFIAFCRSLNISSRYVYGYAYANGGFGAHAWAEVYFPGHGWVPFDLTYEEYGWLDATHFKLAVDYDSNVSDSMYLRNLTAEGGDNKRDEDISYLSYSNYSNRDLFDLAIDSNISKINSSEQIIKYEVKIWSDNAMVVNLLVNSPLKHLYNDSYENIFLLPGQISTINFIYKYENLDAFSISFEAKVSRMPYEKTSNFNLSVDMGESSSGYAILEFLRDFYVWILLFLVLVTAGLLISNR